MTLPQRRSGSVSFPPVRATGVTATASGYEVLKVRILMKVQDRLDTTKSRRMPESLLKQTTRQQIEQVVETDAARLSPAERARLAEEVFAELFGFGPLEELFRDPAVREILVLGAGMVLARRDTGWLPTNVRFRDADQLTETLEKVSAHGDFVGPSLPPSALDMRLANGFRVVAIVPPPALDQPPTVLFVRTESPEASPGPVVHPAITATAAGPHGPLSPTGSASAATTRAAAPNGVGSPLASPAPGEAQLTRLRVKITERIITKMASLGVYDVSRFGPSELRKVVTAYVEEFLTTERIYLSDTDQARLVLEILAAMHR